MGDCTQSWSYEIIQLSPDIKLERLEVGPPVEIFQNNLHEILQQTTPSFYNRAEGSDFIRQIKSNLI